MMMRALLLRCAVHCQLKAVRMKICWAGKEKGTKLSKLTNVPREDGHPPSYSGSVRQHHDRIALKSSISFSYLIASLGRLFLALYFRGEHHQKLEGRPKHEIEAPRLIFSKFCTTRTALE